MALKSYKPTTPGQRGLVLIDRSELWKGRPVKALTEGLTKSGGRNNTGRITMRRKGGGAKRLYRIVDFKRNKFDVAATVERIGEIAGPDKLRLVHANDSKDVRGAMKDRHEQIGKGHIGPDAFVELSKCCLC